METSDLKGFAEQMAAELLQSIKSSDAEDLRLKVDLQDVAKQLNTFDTDQALRNYYKGNYRLAATLKERAERAAKTTYDFIDANLRHALFNLDQFAVLQSRASEIPSNTGNILDLGVYKGGSTRALARIFPDSVIHGFDSFIGLPEDWSHAIKGTFGDLRGVLPDMPENVRLYKGWFDETLPVWAEENSDRPVSLLRVDCDIYSSTKTIFDSVGEFLRPGSWIVFDELFGYYGWEDHEYKAFMEFNAVRKFDYEYIAYGLTYAIMKLK